MKTTSTLEFKSHFAVVKPGASALLQPISTLEQARAIAAAAGRGSEVIQVTVYEVITPDGVRH